MVSQLLKGLSMYSERFPWHELPVKSSGETCMHVRRRMRLSSELLQGTPQEIFEGVTIT